MAASVSKKKCRYYSLEYLKFGFICSPRNETIPMCLLCEKTFGNDYMKPSKMKDHLDRVHSDKKNEELEFFKKLKEKFTCRPTIKSFMKQSTEVETEGGLIASYKISLNIAKKGKPHTIAEEIVMPTIKDVIEDVMKKDSVNVLKSLPLSANSVKRRIDEMAEEIENTVVSELKNCKFSIQLDESVFGVSAILMMYVRYFSKIKGQVIDEFLFAKYLETDGKGETIFKCLQEYLNKYDIPFENIIAVVTDRAPAMVGRYRGFTTFLKEKVPGICTIHCVLHRNNLVAKYLSPELHKALQFCIKCINQIKAQPLKSRLFSKLCEENDELFNQLLLHTEVRWLSRGVCLQRLVELFDSTTEFLSEINPVLSNELQNNKNHIFYIADLFGKFNDVQTKLQGKDVTIIEARTILLGFQVKLNLFRSSLLRKDYQYFSNLRQLEIKEEDLEIYTGHLQKLSDDFKLRFVDLENIDIPDWIIMPFSVQIESVDINLQDELVELLSDLGAKTLFKNLTISQFWTIMYIMQKHVKLYEIAQPFMLSSAISKLSHFQVPIWLKPVSVMSIQS
ncbi:zinc finger BED domain-containing protein 5-like [Parasteatoda tepidariorum]|uniref:zinc finger BED domain-containing protein 5-like n=1 Tax=Parasteatoda tepidariorum TaxID=114398 RepID=UPI0039BC2A0F